MSAIALTLAFVAPIISGGHGPPIDLPTIEPAPVLRTHYEARTPAPGPERVVEVPGGFELRIELAPVAVQPKPPPPPPPPPPPVVQQPVARVADHGDAIARARSAPNGQLPRDALCGLTFSSGLLRCDAAAALEAAVANGMPAVQITSTYRSIADQHAVKASRGAWAAPVGSSVHGFGLAIDAPEPMRSWLHKHGAEFGWINPAWARTEKHEPWHFEWS